MIHDRTKAVAPPKFPFAVDVLPHGSATRRQQLADWLTSPANPYFAKSYVNRLWGYLLGAGIIEPLDDIRAGNPASESGTVGLPRATSSSTINFDVRHVMRLICRSRTYQLSIEVNRWNADDKINYSHALARRLPAEVIYDAIHRVTGSTSRIPGVPDGTLAEALPDAGVKMPDGFLANLGRPARESVCECERASGLQLGSVMALISGPTVEAAISDPHSDLAKLVASEKDDAKLIGDIFLRVLNRPATAKEIELGRAELRQLPAAHKELAASLAVVEKESATARLPLEKQRQKAIAAAQQSLQGFQKQIASQMASQQREQRWKIVAASAALADAEKTLPPRMAAWEQAAKKEAAWVPLVASVLNASNGAKLVQEADRSVFASGPNGKATYLFIAQNTLPNVTALRLEVLSDPRLPAKGPGRAPTEISSSPNSLSSGNRPPCRRRKRTSPSNRLLPTSARTPTVADRNRRHARQGLGRRAADGRVAQGRFPVPRQGRRAGRIHDSIGGRIPRRSAYARPVPHLRDQRPATGLRRPAGEYRAVFWPCPARIAPRRKRQNCWPITAASMPS